MRFSLLLGACMLMAASAYSAPYDLGAVEMGKTYQIPYSENGHELVGTLTPTVSGTVQMTGINGSVELYTAPKYNDNTIVPREWVTNTWGNNWSANYELTANTTYYLYASWLQLSGDDSIVFKMLNDIEVEFIGSDPAAGATVSTLVNGTGEIILTFNTGVAFSGATISAGGKTVTASTGSPTLSKTLAISVKSALAALYSTGALSVDGGDEFTLRVEGIGTSDTNIYGSDGSIELKYINAGKAADILETNFSDQRNFNSYYPAGDPEGILTITFDHPLKEDSPAVMTMGIGNVEVEGGYYYENLPLTIEGSTVTIDLTGRLRELNPYVEYQGSDIVMLQLHGVLDAKGNPVAGQGQGSSGSYTYNFLYKYIQPATISSEFLPKSGMSLEGVDEIEIWFNNANAIKYDGVKFTYKLDGKSIDVVVPTADCKIATENNETTINVAVPAEVKGNKDITVTLANLVSTDGYDHTQEICALYDQFVVNLLAPIQAGARIASTGDDDFVFEINYDDFEYVRYDFFQGEGWDNWAYGTALVKQDDGTYTAFNGNYECFVGVDNHMIIRAYAKENDYWKDSNNLSKALYSFEFHFTGSSTPFLYSSYQFVSINPEPNSVIEYADDFCFTVKFDGLVSIDAQRSGIPLGMGAGMAPFEKIIPVNTADDGDGLANTWKLYPGNSFMQSHDAIDLSIVAYGQDGYLVQGNMIEGNEMDYLSFSYSINNPENYVEIIVTPSAGEVESLSEIIVSCEDQAVGINLNADAMPSIQGVNVDYFYSYVADDFAIVSEITGEDEFGYPVYSEISSVKMILPDKKLAPGTYTLTIPARAFMIGSQFVTAYNAAATVTYTIKATQSRIDIDCDNDFETPIYNLQGIRITTPRHGQVYLQDGVLKVKL